MSPSSFPHTISTKRLLLRRLQAGDAPALCAYRSLPEVARYQSWDHFDLADATRLVESQRSAEAGVPGTWLQLALIESATQTLIGDCGLHCLPAGPCQIELGITLSPSHQGRGFATEALHALLNPLFTTLNAHRLSATVDAENIPVVALFRRLGFRQEAHFVEHLWYKGAWGSEFVFALLRREWEARVLPS